MLSIPLYFLLFAYLGFLVFFFVYMAINFYHIVISGSFTFTTFIVSFFCIILTLATLYFTFTLLENVDWRESITVFSTQWFNPATNF